ncbi:copper chaperone PCu(A)C [Marinomonas balearica]|uniref:Copper(I)-binding protein n=1 Tax=Marinomonas balearica TaxID=491947 RepID=A0A4R6M7A6_9GAMM|nr:copper chaperone PCu(A)C [Marinomonas balearica]TDO97287.1 hypothetical protein DFP79_2104 [Marinomonas balearica]
MFRMISRAVVLVASVFSSIAMAASLNFEHLQVRATPPGATNSGGYMMVENSSHHEQALVAVESDIAKSIEIHTHEMKDGVMSMRQVDEVIVPAGESVMFQPGGNHIMIMGLHHALKAGDTVNFTMVLKNGEKVNVQAPIVAPEDIKKPKHDMDMHKDHMKMNGSNEHKHH